MVNRYYLCQTLDSRIVCNLIFSAVDQTYTAVAASTYHLSVLVTPSRVQLALMDKSRMTYLGVKEYESGIGQFYDFPELLKVLEKEEEWLGLKVESAKIAFCSEKAVLVPSVFAKELDVLSLTKLHFTIKPGEFLQKFALPGMDAQIIQAIPLKADQWAAGKAARRNSFTQVFLQQASLDGYNIRISVLDKYVFIAIFDSAMLIFYNQFLFRTVEEAVYFILFAIQQNQLDPLKVQALISGEVEPGAELLSLLRKYILQVEIQEKYQGYSLANPLQGSAQFRYSTLYSLFHCVS